MIKASTTAPPAFAVGNYRIQFLTISAHFAPIFAIGNAQLQGHWASQGPSLGGTILVRPLGSWLLLVVLVSTGTYLLTMVSTYHVALWSFSEIIKKINSSNWLQICPLSHLNQSKSCFKSLPRKFSFDFIRLNWTTYVKFWILILSIWCAQFVILESKFQPICLPPDKFNLIL